MSNFSYNKAICISDVQYKLQHNNHKNWKSWKNYSMFLWQFFQKFIDEGSIITPKRLEFFPKTNNRRASFIREIRIPKFWLGICYWCYLYISSWTHVFVHVWVIRYLIFMVRGVFARFTNIFSYLLFVSNCQKGMW